MIGSANVAVDVDAANRLNRANAVANETMRLRPVAPLLVLDAKVDTALGDLSLPKGTGVAVLPRPPALDQTNFVDPFGSGLSAGLGTPAGRTMSRPTFRSARVRACARVARSLYLR